jgi:hypothetical protein
MLRGEYMPSKSLSKLTKSELIAHCIWQQNRIMELEETVEKIGYIKRVTETHMRCVVN